MKSKYKGTVPNHYLTTYLLTTSRSMMKLGWNLVVVVEGRHETETGYAIYLRKNQEQKNKALHPALNQTNFFFFSFFFFFFFFFSFFLYSMRCHFHVLNF